MRFDLLNEANSLLTVDKAERFGEVIGRNSTRGDKERSLGVWIPSPSGRFVARLTSADLSVASAADPLALRRVARAPTENDSLGGTAGTPDPTHAIWSPDESRLFYLESRKGPKPPPNVETHGAPAEISLYEVRRDGSDRRLVRRFQAPKFVELLGVDAQAGLVYWVRTGPGGAGSDLTAVSIGNGKARIINPLPEGLPSNWIKIAPAGGKAYVIESERRIIEISLPGGERRIVHEGDGQTLPIQSIEISPDESRLLFEERDDATTTVRLLSLADGRSRTILSKASGENPPRAWSPDGRYLVLDVKTDCGASDDPHLRVIDLEGSDILRLKLDRISCPAEATDAGHPRIIFVAWLQTEPG